MKFFLSALILFTSCLTGSSDDDPIIQEWHYFDPVPDPYELTLEYEEVGNSLELKLYLENKSDSTRPLLFGGYNLGQPYIFVVLDSDSTIMWQEYKGTIDLVGVVVPIEPGKELVHTATWKFDSNYNRRVRANETYTIYGYGNFSYDWNFSLDIDEPSVYMSNPVEYILK
tara:strand:+ start:2840 stop:3349 length:510 start_codon:yes stop_codon:yes gene_type:complete